MPLELEPHAKLKLPRGPYRLVNLTEGSTRAPGASIHAPTCWAPKIRTIECIEHFSAQFESHAFPLEGEILL